MLDLIPKKKFDFLGKRRIAALGSLALIGGSLAVFAFRGEKNFRHRLPWRRPAGGRFQTTLTVDRSARSALEGIGLGDVVIQFERRGHARLVSRSRSPQGTSATFFPSLQEAYPNRDITAVAQENVGPQIGLEFAKEPRWPLALGMIGILIYVTFRFEFSFALGAVVALLHDVHHYAWGFLPDRGRAFAGHGRRDSHHRRLLDQRHDRGFRSNP